MAANDEDAPKILRGTVYTERKSRFQACCAVCKTIHDVGWFRELVLEDPKVANATHNVMAYITPEEEGFDDDGETHAGIQVLKMMQLTGAKDCAVIVTRWYGGVQLHGDRFRIITGQAQQVLKDNGMIAARREEPAAKGGKGRHEEPAAKGGKGKKKRR